LADESYLGLILAIETSCDDTCAAIIDRGGRVRANVISSQGVHDRYGGVVPEIASRHHLELINLVVDQALAAADIGLGDLDLIAATQGPGLVGALLVGLCTAKALAGARGLDLAAVDHLQGHVAACFLAPAALEPPFLCLVASGGHTLLGHVTDYAGMRIMGRTLDDAAGEAFDKGARMLGLGYPGGPALERLARAGDPTAFAFPGGARSAPLTGQSSFARGLDFSFSGLKTALLYRLRELSDSELERRRADLAASYQQAIAESLALRVERALARTGLRRVALGGGVAANGVVRARMGALDAEVHVPVPELCTDNAAMIASAARFVPRLTYPHYLGLEAYATGERAA